MLFALNHLQRYIKEAHTFCLANLSMRHDAFQLVYDEHVIVAGALSIATHHIRKIMSSF